MRGGVKFLLLQAVLNFSSTQRIILPTDVRIKLSISYIYAQKLHELFMNFKTRFILKDTCFTLGSRTHVWSLGDASVCVRVFLILIQPLSG